MDDLLEKAIAMAEISIIKRDLDLFSKIVYKLAPEIQLQMVPYSALFCYEAIDYINNKGADIEFEQTSKYTIKEIRQKAKFFDLSVNKLLQCIENIDESQHRYFIDLMKYPQLGYWNIHTNLGICFDAQKNIVSNTHYSYYLFQDEKSISKSKEDMTSVDIEEDEIMAFACDVGKIIGNISRGLSSISDFIVADVNADDIILQTQDFNTNRCMVGDKKYKIIRLFLLHILSNIGFILFVLKKIIIRDSGLLLRFEYITYHYSLIRLEGILNYCKSIDVDKELKDVLKSIDYTNSNNLRKTEFRNCMMHFGLKDSNGTPLIDKDKLNLALPFCGLVETQFELSYEDYRAQIEDALLDIYIKLKNYLNFELLLDTNS